MTLQEITKLMAILATEYENFQISEERIGLWNEIIGYANFQEGLRALKYFFTQALPFPPKIGEINQKILELRKEDRRKESYKELPEPEISPEQIEKNKKLLQELSATLASKKGIN